MALSRSFGYRESSPTVPDLTGLELARSSSAGRSAPCWRVCFPVRSRAGVGQWPWTTFCDQTSAGRSCSSYTRARLSSAMAAVDLPSAIARHRVLRRVPTFSTMQLRALRRVDQGRRSSLRCGRLRADERARRLPAILNRDGGCPASARLSHERVDVIGFCAARCGRRERALLGRERRYVTARAGGELPVGTLAVNRRAGPLLLLGPRTGSRRVRRAVPRRQLRRSAPTRRFSPLDARERSGLSRTRGSRRLAESSSQPPPVGSAAVRSDARSEPALSDERIKLTTYTSASSDRSTAVRLPTTDCVCKRHRFSEAILSAQPRGVGRLHHVHRPTGCCLCRKTCRVATALARARRDGRTPCWRPCSPPAARAPARSRPPASLIPARAQSKRGRRRGRRPYANRSVGRGERVGGRRRSVAIASCCASRASRPSVLLGVGRTASRAARARSTALRARRCPRSRSSPSASVADHCRRGATDDATARPLVTLERVRICKRDVELRQATLSLAVRTPRSRAVAEADRVHSHDRRPTVATAPRLVAPSAPGDAACATCLNVRLGIPWRAQRRTANAAAGAGRHVPVLTGRDRLPRKRNARSS